MEFEECIDCNGYDDSLHLTACEIAGDHLPQQDHRWQECPVYHDDVA